MLPEAGGVLAPGRVSWAANSRIQLCLSARAAETQCKDPSKEMWPVGFRQTRFQLSHACHDRTAWKIDW
jgi:hypothetical protein